MHIHIGFGAEELFQTSAIWHLREGIWKPQSRLSVALATWTVRRWETGLDNVKHTMLRCWRKNSDHHGKPRNANGKEQSAHHNHLPFITAASGKQSGK